MKPKTFDCVEMKQDIQRRILEEFKDMTPEAQEKLTRERIAADPVFGPIWRKALSQLSRDQSSKSRKA